MVILVHLIQAEIFEGEISLLKFFIKLDKTSSLLSPRTFVQLIAEGSDWLE